MKRFVEEADRGQWTLLPECLDDFIDESNPVRVIDGDWDQTIRLDGIGKAMSVTQADFLLSI